MMRIIWKDCPFFHGIERYLVIQIFPKSSLFKLCVRSNCAILQIGNVPSGISEDEVSDKFIEFIEEQGWFFGGRFRMVDDDKPCDREVAK